MNRYQPEMKWCACNWRRNGK